MKFVPNQVSRLAGRTVLRTKVHSPAILFGTGVVGMVGTVVLASRATLRLESVLEDIQKEQAMIEEARGGANYSEQDARHDRAVVLSRATLRLVKLYGPAFVLGVTSVACLTGAHNIQNKRIAGMTAAYMAVDKAFGEYRDRVREEFGEEKERELRYAVEDQEQTTVAKNGAVNTKKVKGVGVAGASMYARFFDETNPNWSRTPGSNQLFINCQQNYANDMLQTKGHLFLNEVYDLLGMERTPEGQLVGWVWKQGTGDDYIDFGVFSDFNKGKRFVQGEERSVLLDFNVDGPIHELLSQIPQEIHFTRKGR